MEFKLVIDDVKTVLDAQVKGEIVSIESSAREPFRFELLKQSEHEVILRGAQGKIIKVPVSAPDADGNKVVVVEGRPIRIGRDRPSRSQASGCSNDGAGLAPLSGTVRKINVAVGDVVEAGSALAMMEAMKMQMTISAPYNGKVEAILVEVGQSVQEGQELVRIQKEE